MYIFIMCCHDSHGGYKGRSRLCSLHISHLCTRLVVNVCSFKVSQHPLRLFELEIVGISAKILVEWLKLKDLLQMKWFASNFSFLCFSHLFSQLDYFSIWRSNDKSSWKNYQISKITLDTSKRLQKSNLGN